MPGLDLITRSTTLPLTVSEVKEHLRVTITEDDDLILAYLTAAIRHAESLTHKTLVETTYDLFLDDFPPTDRNGKRPIYLQMPRVSSVTYFKYYNGDNVLTTLVKDADYYESLHGNWPYLVPVTSWPSVKDKPDSVVVRYVTAPGAIPENVLLAVKMLTAGAYGCREWATPANIEFKELPGALAVNSLLSTYKRRTL